MINNLFEYVNFSPLVALALLLFVIMIMININNRNMYFIFTGLNIIIILFIIWNHGINIIDNIDSFWNANIFKNIYFYLTNMIVSLLVVTSILQSKQYDNSVKYIVMVLYYFLLVDIVTMLFTSDALKKIVLIIILIYILCFKKKVSKHRLGDHL